jgi:5-methyltetrahydrofolate--homocysteine methyltransferase
MPDSAAVHQRFTRGGLILDGGLGSMLIAHGLPPGTAPESWNLDNPGAVRAIHAAYLASGAMVVSTNTFGGTPSRLAAHGLGGQVAAVNAAGVRIAREAVLEHEKRVNNSPARLIALSLGPTGQMLPPLGQATEAGIRDEYAAQISGIEGDFDVVFIETIFDLREGLLALEAVKASLRQPVAVSLTYDRKPRGFFTSMGTDVRTACSRLEDAGADIIGANCSISSEDMLALAGVLRASTSLPVLCQPNAGSPVMKGGAAVYEQTPASFADDAMRMFELGVNAVGGCCGTTPAFIEELSRRWSAGNSSGA